jgi:hypothetical protein
MALPVMIYMDYHTKLQNPLILVLISTIFSSIHETEEYTT